MALVVKWEFFEHVEVGFFLFSFYYYLKEKKKLL